ncbi:MAG: acyloxyacyl hydrolase [Sphingomonas sp.]|nr:acyloxyacyl hydrolase [Sphingomonas sp.]
MKSIQVICAALLMAVVPSAAQAGELFGGLHIHDVKTPLDKSGIEDGVDLSIGYRGGRMFGTFLQPYVFGALNSSGATSYAAAGLSARFGFGRGWYIRPGVGLAIHNGSADKFYRTDKIAFGSRVLFEPEVGIGAQINKRVSVEASWVHMSHAQLEGRENPGIDNLGVRVNLAL